MSFDRHVIIKKMAKELLRDYGHEAYEAFCQKNPNARWKLYEEKRRAAAAESEQQDAEIIAKRLVIPQLCGPMGRVMP